MNDPELRSFMAGERHRLVNYVRNLLAETAAMDAEDVVHDVLVKMLERPDNTAPLDNMAAYVFRSLRNRVIDNFRTDKPMSSMETEEGSGNLIELLHELKLDPLQLLQTHQGKAVLFEALEMLGDMERQVIIAHEFEGVSFRELARAWDMPLNTLLSHKSRAMK